MLLAIPYMLIARTCMELVADGAPGWLNLVIPLCLWNAFKFLGMGPVSVVLLLRVTRHKLLRRPQFGSGRQDA